MFEREKEDIGKEKKLKRPIFLKQRGGKRRRTRGAGQNNDKLPSDWEG